MWSYPEIDPVALDLGFIQIHWYGLMYLLGFAGAYVYGTYRAKIRAPWNSDLLSDLIFYAVIGVIVGGRVGYILFYEFAFYLENPMAVFRVWEGGMSFHGGLLGVVLAMFLFAKKTNQTLFEVADFTAPLVPIGLFFGRIGNFINGELWGRTTDSPLGMWVYDPVNLEKVQRYPTQLLEALLEGLVLLIILAIYSSKARRPGAVAGMFLLGYGVFRFIVEFWRLPDAQLGYLLWDWVTMGQILSLPMILLGAFLVFRPVKVRAQ